MRAFTGAPLKDFCLINSKALRVSSSLAKLANQKSPMSGRRLEREGHPSPWKISWTFCREQEERSKTESLVKHLVYLCFSGWGDVSKNDGGAGYFEIWFDESTGGINCCGCWFSHAVGYESYICCVGAEGGQCRKREEHLRVHLWNEKVVGCKMISG